MSLLEDVHDALTMIPGVLPETDRCHFTAASTDWREKFAYAMRGIEDQSDTIEDLQSELAREERNVAFEEKRANGLVDEVADLKAEVAMLNHELISARNQLKKLQPIATETAAQ